MEEPGMRAARRIVLFCGVAVVNVLSTLLPVWPVRYHLLAHRLPDRFILAAQDVTLLLGVTLLVIAYPTALRHRRAAQIFMLCAALGVVANLIKGLDIEEACVNLAAVAVLWKERHTLQTFRLRYTIVDLARLAVALAAIVWTYNVVGEATLDSLHVLLLRDRSTFPPAAIIVHIMTAKLPLQLSWFDEAQLLLPIFVVCVFLVFSWTSLMQARETTFDSAELYQRYGRASHNSLAYLARRSDVITFMEPNGRGVITYRQVGRVALQIGAILAPAADRPAVYRAFLEFCRAQRLIPAAVALSQDERPIARACGMRTVTIGTEAIVDLADFAVSRLGKKMRWVQRSLTKRGYTCALLSAAELLPQLRVALDHIDDEWRTARGGQLHGCCMTLGRFPTHADPECLVAVAYDATQSPVAYVTLLPGGGGLYSLDLTRRRSSAPNAIIELLLLEVLGQLQARGAASVSLNFSTFSSVGSRRGGSALLALVGRWFQLGTLEAFNTKFRPRWVPRYAAFPSVYSLPDVAHAILSVEGVDRMVVNAVVRGIRRRLGETGARRVATRAQSEAAFQ
jgi:lysyl-tRNA synthetase class 2